MSPFHPNANTTAPGLPANAGVSGLFKATSKDGDQTIAFTIDGWSGGESHQLVQGMIAGKSSAIEAIAGGLSRGFRITGKITSRDASGLGKALSVLVGSVSLQTAYGETLTFNAIATGIRINVNKGQSEHTISASITPAVTKLGLSGEGNDNLVVEVLDGASFRDADESRNDSGRRRFWFFNLTAGDYTLDSAALTNQVAAVARTTYPSHGGQSIRYVDARPLRHNAVEAVCYYGPASFFDFVRDSPNYHLSTGRRTLTRWKVAGDDLEAAAWLVNASGDEHSPIIEPSIIWSLYYQLESSNPPVQTYTSLIGKTNIATKFGAAAGTLMFIGMNPADPITSSTWLQGFEFEYSPTGWYQDIVPRRRDGTYDYAAIERRTPEQVSFDSIPSP